MKKQLKIVFMGTASFAVPSLEILMNAGYKIVAVVTAPDKPAGRGRKLRSSPVKEFAIKNDLKILQPINLKDDNFIGELKELKPDIQVVVAFRMLPVAVWKIPPLGTFNLHSSLLPQYRGAAPINHVIINGEKETGVTTFLIDEKIDTGRILFREKTKIENAESAGELHDRLMILGAGLVLKTVKALQAGNINALDQTNYFEKEEGLKPAPKIFKENCRIDWNKPQEEIYNQIRGLSPVPAAFCLLKTKNGKIMNLKVYKSEINEEKFQGVYANYDSDEKTFLIVKCNNGSLKLADVQLEGKKRMNILDFLRGFKISEIEEVL
jgi:methionyl-tRNA formyltransferase